MSNSKVRKQRLSIKSLTAQSEDSIVELTLEEKLEVIIKLF